LPGSEQARREVLESVAGELSAQHPTWFPRHGERLENRLTGESWDLAAPACDPLELAGRLVQEDLCILQPLDHDDFGSSRSKIMNVIDSNNLERDAGEKPVPTFSHPALASGLVSVYQRSLNLSSNSAPCLGADGE
jgi:hypothetical protein